MRRDKRSTGDNHDRWLVSYADFITLLFAFFTVLYATSERNVEKTKEFQESVKKYLIKVGGFGGSGEKIEQGEKYNQIIEPPIQTFPSENPKTEKVMDSIEQLVERSFTKEEREKYFIDLSMDEMGVRLAIGADEIFDGDSYKFKTSALPFLDKLGKLLTQINLQIAIDGHTVQKSFGNYDAWEMSSLRATTAAKYFHKVHKISGDALVAMSHGALKPLVKDTAGELAGKNSRLELLIITGAIEL